jgi:hypothetical protein
MIYMQRSDVIAVKGKPHITEMIPLLLVSVLFIVLSGCGVRSNANASLKNEILSPKEKDLVMLFKSLLQMDYQPALLISKNQAVEMLPLVNQSAEDGGVIPETEKKILALLTLEQRNYLNDQASRTKQFTDEINVEQQMIDLLESKTSH